MKIFAYTMVYDTGFAPSVDKGILSLACCKTFLRYKIANELLDNSDDIYVVGLCGKQMSGRHNYDNDYFPVYIAKISDCVKTDYYYSKRAYKTRPDSQYLLENGVWYFKKNNPHHIISDNKEIEELPNPNEEKDLFYIRGNKHEKNYVLISTDYVYFGKYYSNNHFEVPPFLVKIGNERKEACRSDLSPIEILNKKEQEELVKFVFDNSKLFSKQNRNNTIDKYFIDRKSCGEKSCR